MTSLFYNIIKDGRPFPGRWRELGPDEQIPERTMCFRPGDTVASLINPMYLNSKDGLTPAARRLWAGADFQYWAPLPPVRGNDPTQDLV